MHFSHTWGTYQRTFLNVHLTSICLEESIYIFSVEHAMCRIRVYDTSSVEQEVAISYKCIQYKFVIKTLNTMLLGY